MDYERESLEIWRASLNPLDKRTAEAIEDALRRSASDAFNEAAFIVDRYKYASTAWADLKARAKDVLEKIPAQSHSVQEKTKC